MMPNETTEARQQFQTVRSAARRAIRNINAGDGKIEIERKPAGVGVDGYYGPETVRFRDPAADQMVALLQVFLDSTKDYAVDAKKAL